MLTKFTTTKDSKSVNLLKTQQVGRVVDNNDPRKLLRVKVYVKGVYEDADVSKLPWAFQNADSSLGGKPDSSFFAVPEIGSEVLVSWPTNDPYHPYYGGRRQNSLTAPQEPFDEDYPNSYGTIDSAGHWFKINKESKFFEFFSSFVGHHVKFDGAGNLTISIPKNVTLQVGSELQIQVGASTIISSGINHIQNCGNTMYLNANNGYGITGGGGGVNISAPGRVSIRSNADITMDAPQIHENSGLSPGALPTPSEYSALQGAIDSINTTITDLNRQAQNIQARLTEVADKIGK
ncbi:MAG: phage baseplate assembly protein V [Candidatus Pacearchaeota archaeon]